MLNMSQAIKLHVRDFGNKIYKQAAHSKKFFMETWVTPKGQAPTGRSKGGSE